MTAKLRILTLLDQHVSITGARTAATFKLAMLQFVAGWLAMADNHEVATQKEAADG